MADERPEGWIERQIAQANETIESGPPWLKAAAADFAERFSPAPTLEPGDGNDGTLASADKVAEARGDEEVAPGITRQVAREGDEQGAWYYVGGFAHFVPNEVEAAIRARAMLEFKTTWRHDRIRALEEQLAAVTAENTRLLADIQALSDGPTVDEWTATLAAVTAELEQTKQTALLYNRGVERTVVELNVHEREEFKRVTAERERLKEELWANGEYSRGLAFGADELRGDVSRISSQLHEAQQELGAAEAERDAALAALREIHDFDSWQLPLHSVANRLHAIAERALRPPSTESTPQPEGAGSEGGTDA